MNLITLIGDLKGKKTYLVAALAIVYLFGGEQGWWNISQEIMGILGALGLASLRAGVAKAESASSSRPGPKGNGAGTFGNVLIAAGFGAALLVQTGCAKVAPGHDPVVVNAERTTTMALETFDAFVLWEYENRDSLAALPEIRRTADVIRRNAPIWLASARAATKAYKDNRTKDNQLDLEASLALLRSFTAEARRYLTTSPPPQ